MTQSMANLVLENVYLTGDPRLFLVKNEDGTINWGKSNASIKVAANRSWTNANDETVTNQDYFEINVRGQKNIGTICQYCYKGKELTKVVCDVRTIKKDTDKINPKTNKPYQTNVPVLNLIQVNLGNDPKAVREKAIKQAVQSLISKGLFPPVEEDALKTLSENVAVATANREKKRDWDEEAARKTGKFGHALVWSKDKGNWIDHVSKQKDKPQTAEQPQSQEELMAQIAQLQQRISSMAQTQTQQATAEAHSDDGDLFPGFDDDNFPPF